MLVKVILAVKLFHLQLEIKSLLSISTQGVEIQLEFMLSLFDFTK